MEEIGIVKSVDGINAKVIVSRKSSCCESCTKDACTVPETGFETDVLNTVGANVGQKVKIVMKPYTYLKGAFFIYIFPVVSLIGGAIVGKMYVAPLSEEVHSDLIAAIAGFIFFFISIFLIKLLASRKGSRTEYTSVIESIMEG